MVCHKNPEASQQDSQYAIGVTDIQDGTYANVAEASKALGLSQATMARRLNGGKTRTEVREDQQLLTQQEEKALVDWISQATATGNPISHPYMKKIAEEIRKSRAGTTREFLKPIGTTWTRVFMR